MIILTLAHFIWNEKHKNTNGLNNDQKPFSKFNRIGLKVKVLLIEDDIKISSFIEKGLKEQGYIVDCCDDGNQGYLMVFEPGYDLIILDIMLPGKDGLSILRSLRENKHTVPVIILTARSTVSERIDGLNMGADDYLCKPFYIGELIARITAITRRSSGCSLNLLNCEDLTLNLITREVKIDNNIIDLTNREFNLLELLMRQPGRVLTRTQILEHVWGYGFDPQTNIVDVYIRRLRNKIYLYQKCPEIVTVRGVGYRLKKNEDKKTCCD
jgi:DNA-binding response OmpR family regulator